MPRREPHLLYLPYCRASSSPLRKASLLLRVLQKVARNNAAYVPVITDAAVCGGASYSMSISLPSGVSSSRWIYRENGSIWKNTTSSSSSYFESSNNTKVLVPTLREYKIVVNDNNNCFSDTSAAVSINISTSRKPWNMNRT